MKKFNQLAKKKLLKIFLSSINRSYKISYFFFFFFFTARKRIFPKVLFSVASVIFFFFFFFFFFSHDDLKGLTNPNQIFTHDF